MSINKRFKQNGMNNNKKNIQRFNTKYTKIKKIENKKSTKSVVKFIIYLILFFIIIGFLSIIIIYNKLFKDLDIEKLKNLQLGETSIIYDKNGKEFFKLYEEKRTYVDYEEISKNMVNALVAGEDQRFWTNPGFDLIGLIRSGIKSIGSGTVRGTSTLTQQLIRNTIITKKPNENLAEGIDRKLKEVFLSYRVTKEISKEKILELYLNKIEFGHNAFGIEEAAKTFFAKSAKDLNVFESSVLASLPKGPTYYSPYNHADRTVGYFIYKNSNVVVEETSSGETEQNKQTKSVEEYLVSAEEVASHKEIIEKYKQKIQALKGKGVDGSEKFIICGVEKESLSGSYDVDNSGCVVLEYKILTTFLSDIFVTSGSETLSYNTGRKDYILQRMLEDEYIDFEQLKSAYLEGFGYQFTSKIDEFVAPHFVFYVKEYLEDKYGDLNIATGGFKIYTTIDLDVQKKAEEIVKNYSAKNTSKFNAKNSALIALDNSNGGILAMVGSTDYFNEDGKGQVNVITSKLQPGSSFKPFVYSLAMQENEIGTKTPVYDLATTFPGNYKPKNFDGSFMGKIDVSTALNHSRNIPAVKMFYMTGGINDIVTFMHKLGATSLNNDPNYGASLALGTGEMTPLDLAKAYSVFANMGEKVEINPILKIEDSKGQIIEDNSEGKKERVMSTGQAFVINSILSDSSTRPAGRNSYLGLSGRISAVKTGTSTKPVNNTQYPANLWTAGYTPQYTTVVWSGNIDGENLYYAGNGLEASGPIRRDFMNYIHSGKEAKNWSKPEDVRNVTISEISGYLPNPEAENNNFLVSSYFINPPKKTDNSNVEVEYDAMCNGKVTENTPFDAIKKTLVLEFHSLKPDNSAWENPVQERAKSAKAIEKYGVAGVVKVTNEVCQRSGDNGGEITIKSNLSSSGKYNVGKNDIQIAYKSNSNIIELKILLNGELLKVVPIVGDPKIGGVYESITIPEKYENSTVKVEISAINSEYYKNSEITNIKVGSVTETETGNTENTENNANSTEQNTNNQNLGDISINVTNPKKGSIKINPEDYFNLRFSVSPTNNLSSVMLYINGNLYQNLGTSGDYVLPINQESKLNSGTNDIKIEVLDLNGEKITQNISVEIL